MSRSKSNNQWLQQHFNDPFVKQAQREGYRSRAVYKLIEINQKHRLFKHGQSIVDLGTAPGGWLQVAQKFSKDCKIIGVDILPVEPINGVEFIKGDFTEPAIFEKLSSSLNQKSVDLVLSDMAPNLSGLASVDIPKTMYLAELATDFADTNLIKGGSLLVKVFQGEGFDLLLKNLRQKFVQVISCKPKASRSKSKEIYLLCKDKH